MLKSISYLSCLILIVALSRISLGKSINGEAINKEELESSNEMNNKHQLATVDEQAANLDGLRKLLLARLSHALNELKSNRRAQSLGQLLDSEINGEDEVEPSSEEPESEEPEQQQNVLLLKRAAQLAKNHK